MKEVVAIATTSSFAESYWVYELHHHAPTRKINFG